MLVVNVNEIMQSAYPTFITKYIYNTMNKINRYRKTQTISIDDFLLKAIEEQSCKFCKYHDECKEYITDIDEYEITGCTAFDNSIENLEQIYINNYCN